MFLTDCPLPQFMEIQSTNITAVEGYNTSLKCFFDGFYSQSSSLVQMWALFPHNTTSIMLGNHPPPECKCSIEFKNKPVCFVDTDPNDCCKFEVIMHSTPHVNMTGTAFSCTKNFSSEEAVWMCK